MIINKIKQKEIKRIVKNGMAIDITDKDIIKGLTVFAVSRGVNGVNGLILIDENRMMYAITKRTSEIDYYF
jgi:hypothetical protein